MGQKFILNLNFIRGFYIIQSFLLSIIGLGSISQGMLSYNGSLNQGVWIAKSFDVHSAGKTIGLVLGLLELIVGGIGVMGVIKKKQNLLLAYNFSAIAFFLCSMVVTIFAILSARDIDTENCGSTENLREYREAARMGQLTLCSPKCHCNMTDINQFHFDDKTKARIKKYQSPNGEKNAQSCPGFMEDLQKKLKIDENEAYDVIDNLKKIENLLKCGGWCKQDDLYQIYSFTNINRGPPLEHNGCFIQLQEQYWSASMKFACIGAIVAGLSLVNIIITGIYYHQRSKEMKGQHSNFRRKISLFDEKKRK